MRSLIVFLASLGAALADNTTYQCGRLDRVGPPSEGGKYVCGLPPPPRVPALPGGAEFAGL